MKSPIEILKEKERLEKLRDSLRNSSSSGITVTHTIHSLNAKIMALEWVLSEKP